MLEAMAGQLVGRADPKEAPHPQPLVCLRRGPEEMVLVRLIRGRLGTAMREIEVEEETEIMGEL